MAVAAAAAAAPAPEKMDGLILELRKVDAVKFGEFKLKCGMLSPVYIDLRVLVSHPKLMKEVSELIYQEVKAKGLKFDSVCGVPYTALPLATIICSTHELPMLIRRKEAKDYGTKRIVDGVYREGDTCLIIEDTVTTGSSVLETAEVLNKLGLKVTDAVVFIDREQGGHEMLASEGITLHPVLSMSKLLNVLEKAERIDEKTSQMAQKFIRDNNTLGPKEEKNLNGSVHQKQCNKHKVDNAERINDVSVPKKPQVEPKVDASCA